MQKLTNPFFLLVAGGMLSFGANTYADTFDVTAEVSSTISLSQTTAFTLGTIYVRPADTGDTGAILSVSTGGAVSTTDGADTDGSGSDISKFVSLGGQEAGVISITGAAPFGTVTITSSAASDLEHSSGNPSLPTIEFTSVTTDPATSLTLDGTGAGDILVGGTFTAANSTAAYADGSYTGTYEITVAY